MRVLFLTWEFPPLIAGGLGMACYGMVKALLGLGLEVDLVLPTVEEVYFPLRSPVEADQLPAVWLKPSPQKERQWKRAATMVEKMKILGASARPETYLNPGFAPMMAWARLFLPAEVAHGQAAELLTKQLIGGGDLFQKVQELTIRAASYARALKFDLIHAHDWLTYPAGLLLKEMSGRPLVAHIHATEFDRAGGVGNERVHQIEYAGMSRADLVIAVSRYTAQMVINRYRIPTAKVRVIHNAHSIPLLPPEERRRIFAGPLILFLGRITIQKGPDYFLDVARGVLKRHPEAHFVMSGAGDMRRRIIHKSASYRLKQHFLLTDFLQRQEVEDLLDSTDVFIMPSVSEPFGITPLEAMAHGVATIISKQSGVAEVIESALKIDFWAVEQMIEAVCSLIEDRTERLRLAQAGQKEAHALKWEEAAKKIMVAYKEAVRC